MADGGHGRGPEVREAEIAALVDGLLTPARAAEIEARAAASPGLAAEIAAQRAAVSALRIAADDAGAAPAGLRARVGEARGGAAWRRRGPRRALLGGVAVAMAVVIALAVVLLPSGAGGPTVAAAADLAARPADAPAPGAVPGRPALLDLEVDGVAFPAWDAEFGWRADGSRRDDLDGRTARTVSYAKDGNAVAYTIVSGDALEAPAGARPVRRDGVDLRVLERDGRTVVTWQRDGRTCVLSAEGVDEDTLLKLAVWKGAGAVTF